MMKIRLTFICLLAAISSLAYSQEWVQQYDSLVTDHFLKKAEFNFELADSSIKKAEALASQNSDEERIFQSFILEIEYLLGLGVHDFEQVQKKLTAFEQAYFDGLTSRQKAQLKNTYAWYYFDTGNFNSAYENALDGYNYGRLANNEPEIEAGLRIMSYSKKRLGDLTEAIVLGQLALEYDKENHKNQTLMNWGVYQAYRELGHIDQGLPFLLNSLESAKMDPDPSILSASYTLLSDYYTYLGDFSTSVKYTLEGIELAKSISDTNTFLATHYQSIGNLYYMTEQYEMSLQYYQKAYTIDRNLNIREYYLYNLLLSVNASHIKLKHYQLAKRQLFEILNYYESINDSALISTVYASLSEVESQQRNYKESKNYIFKALSYLENIKESTHFIPLYRQLLSIPDSLFSATEKFETAELLLEQTKSIELYYIDALILNARLHYQHNSELAFVYGKQAIQLIESKRGGLQQISAHMFAKYADFYKSFGFWHATLRNDIKQTFELFELANSRILLDGLSSTHSMKNDTGDLTINLRHEIDSLYNNKDLNLDSVDINLLIKNLEYDLLEEEQSSMVAKSKPQVTLQATQELLDDETAILYYGLVQNQVYILVVKNGETYFFESDIRADYLDNLVTDINKYRDAIIRKETESVLSNLAAPLYDALTKPIERKLASINNLIIIPDGALAYLPFEALKDSRGYLVEHYSIKYAPSISNLMYLTERKNSRSNALFSLANSGKRKSTLNDSSGVDFYDTIPFAPLEVDAISAFFDDVMVVKNGVDVEEKIKQEDLSKYEYLHFATHALVDDYFSDQSGLFLMERHNDKVTSSEDGVLNVREIRNLELNAGLVVLSACNTGTGKIVNGEGIMSIQRAFFIAGASSVISGLWEINDRSGHEFMKAFYSNMAAEKKKGSTFLNRFWGKGDQDLMGYKARALHQTKLSMLEHPYYNHPVYWASFIITGR